MRGRDFPVSSFLSVCFPLVCSVSLTPYPHPVIVQHQTALICVAWKAFNPLQSWGEPLLLWILPTTTGLLGKFCIRGCWAMCDTTPAPPQKWFQLMCFRKTPVKDTTSKRPGPHTVELRKPALWDKEWDRGTGHCSDSPASSTLQTLDPYGSPLKPSLKPVFTKEKTVCSSLRS